MAQNESPWQLEWLLQEPVVQVPWGALGNPLLSTSICVAHGFKI